MATANREGVPIEFMNRVKAQKTAKEHASLQAPSLPVLGDPDGRYRQWRDRKSPYVSSDPRFEVSFADRSDLPEVYDVVDDAFGQARSRDLFAWRYERNPHGLARVVVIRERESGAIASCVSQFPWPMAVGSKAVDGNNGGDSATRRRWQRQGLRRLNHEFGEALEHDRRYYGIGWPNLKTRNQGKKHQRTTSVGALPLAVLPLRSAPVLERKGLPGAAAAMAGRSLDTLQGLWRGLLERSGGVVASDVLRRFDTSFDGVTARFMAWDGYWCPRNATFLNWRYLDHPESPYTAIAASDGGSDPLGYCVVRTSGPRAWLMDLVAPVAPRRVAISLVCRAVAVAREAGCETLEFSATPGWRHWDLLRLMGMRIRPSEVWFFAATVAPKSEIGSAGDEEASRVKDVGRWQCVPGDMDSL